MTTSVLSPSLTLKVEGNLLTKENMDTQVKITMTTTQFQTLQALLKYAKGDLTDEQLYTILVSIGYSPEAYRIERMKSNIPYLYEQSLKAIQ